jgi:hypothetical protein
MIDDLPIPNLVPVDVLHLEASPGRRYTNEEATVHRQTPGSEVDTTHLASNDDVISLSHHIEYVPSMVREGMVDVVENPADAFSADRHGLRLRPTAKLLVDALQSIGGSERLPLHRGKCRNVKSSSPASSKLAITGGQRSRHFFTKLARAFSTASRVSP